MPLWPFRKRRKRAAEKKPAPPEFQATHTGHRVPSRRSSQRRTSSHHSFDHVRRSYVSSDIAVPEFPLPPNQSVRLPRGFKPQKQPHEGGFSSYFSEGEENIITPESSDQERPHKPTSIQRKLSKRRQEKYSPPPAAYNNGISRQSSRKRARNSLEGRPLSVGSVLPRDSLDSDGSAAFRVGSIDLYAPHPTFKVDGSSSPTSLRSGDFIGPGLVPTRSSSRRTTSRSIANDQWRYRGTLISEETAVNPEHRVADLADGLDVRAIREIMERDRRRKEKRKQEQAERARRRLEKQLQRQNAPQQTAYRPPSPVSPGPNFDDVEMFDVGGDGSREQIGYAITTPMDTAARAPSKTGTQTPLSWYNDNPSVENVPKSYEEQQFLPRPDVVTPVSMDSGEYRAQASEQRPGAAELPIVPSTGLSDSSFPDRTRSSVWASFFKKRTKARSRKVNSSRTIHQEQSMLLSDSEGEDNNRVNKVPSQFLEVEDLRHREGQTPGRHIPQEVAVAMTALETGHIQDKEYEDELRDKVDMSSHLTPYRHGASHASSASSLEENATTPRPTSGAIEDQSRQSSRQSQRHSSASHRYSSGGASPDNAARSHMSTSLASIDSEGSWLSGKINPRQSFQRASPFRTSASSLRRKYEEIDDDSGTRRDEYFSGVGPPEQTADDNEIGATRLDMDDSDDESISSEDEKSMWRDGTQKPIVMQEQPTHARIPSQSGLLNDFDDKTIIAVKVDDDPGPESETLVAESSVFETPLEHPAPISTPISPGAFETPMEYPMQRMDYIGSNMI